MVQIVVWFEGWFGARIGDVLGHGLWHSLRHCLWQSLRNYLGTRLRHGLWNSLGHGLLLRLEIAQRWRNWGPGACRGICAGGGEGFTTCIACFASKSISLVSITSPSKISGKELAVNSENLLSIFLSDVNPENRILFEEPLKDNSTISGS